MNARPDMSTLPADLAARFRGVMDKREAAGLHLVWDIPGRGEWSAYASNEETKAKWIENGNRKGWIYKGTR